MTLPFEFDGPIWDSDKQVYAHYFPTFPLSIDNKPSASDYYQTQFLTTTGENGKHKAYGGFLRSRPMPVPVSTDPNWKQLNLQKEIHTAIARGITGFCYDLMGMTDPNFMLMLNAANAAEPLFKIILMIDCPSATVDQVVSLFQTIDNYPALKRLPDGRILFSAYNAFNYPAGFWDSVIKALNKQSIYVAFMPVTLGGASDAGVLNPISWGVGCWGTATPGSSSALNPTKAHAAGLKFMCPVDPQQARPKGGTYWEAANTDAFVASWTAAIHTGCEMVQLVTWNDYSESAQISPCTDATFNASLGNGFYDLTAYYATWFTAGWEPEITKDVLYYAYRRHPTNAAHPGQPNGVTIANPGGGSPSDLIEVLAFLTEPGIVQINGTKSGLLPVGVNAFSIPTSPGVPTFTLLRNGSTVFSAAGPAQIYGSEGLPSGILDFTYLNGSLSASGVNVQV